MLSWQEPQTRRVGRVYQTSFSSALVSWQVVQSKGALLLLPGQPTVDQSPSMTYGVPAITLGRYFPTWSLWKKSLASACPFAPFVALWQRRHILTVCRVPPWNCVAPKAPPSGSWQRLQLLATSMLFQTEFAASGLPSVRKS